MGSKVVVLVAAHKAYRMPEDQMYLPVQVGACGKADIGFQRDDEGENISSLNPLFCELTGTYWAWKHLDAEYIGLVHYRRLFAGRGKGNPWQRALTYQEIEPCLGKIRVFVPGRRYYLIETLYSHYAHTHHAEHLDEVRKILLEKHPDMVPACDAVFRQRWGYMFNMMIMEKSLFHEYSEWLFGLLFELRTKVKEEGLSAFQLRYCGRVSEILFNIWLRYKLEKKEIAREEIRELPVICTERTNWLKKGGEFLKARLFGTKYEH